MRLAMKILRYFVICFFALSLTKGQEIQKDGEKPTTFTYEEALEMLKARDAQWESKLAKADSLINMYKYGEEMYEDNLSELEEQIKLDSLLLLAQRKQIDLLKSRDKANEEMIKLVEKKWYENQYLWLGIGFILGKI
jgi:hypothetical protein|tara:strand:- start:3 stop:413 length:411 start_codon:yes stop_codon:yes gene_type:complete